MGQAGLSIPELFLAVGLANLAVSLYVFIRVPEYLQRFAAIVRGRRD
jgi:hypothetical protein